MIILKAILVTALMLCHLPGADVDYSYAVKMCEGDGTCYSVSCSQYFYPDDPPNIRPREILPELPDGIRHR